MKGGRKIDSCCEVCGSKSIVEVLNLGEHPLCDDLIPIGSNTTCAMYPIDIVFCTNCFTAFQNYDVEKIKTVGDCIVGSSGISTVSTDPVKDVVNCAVELISLSLDQQIQWQLHFGIHFGPVVAGVIGTKSIQYDFLGETVNTAFSICDLSKPNEILISNNAWMQSRNTVKVTSAGLNKLKGKTDYEIFKVTI